MKTENNNHFVYLLLDIRKPGKYIYGKYEFNHEPFYVGKGYNITRPNDHFREAKADRGSNEIKKNIILDIIKETDSLPKILYYKNNLEKGQSYNLEKNMIKTIGKIIDNEGPLANIADGGYVASSSSLHTSLKKQAANKGKTSSKKLREKIKKTLCKRKYKITMPNGEIRIIDSVEEFCKNNSLDSGAMYKVVKGLYKQFKGYQVEIISGPSYIPKPKDIVFYELVSPTKVNYSTNDIYKFAKLFNIISKRLIQVANNAAIAHMGWSVKKNNKFKISELTHYFEPNIYYYYFFDMYGNSFKIEDLKKFSINKNLDYNNLIKSILNGRFSDGLVGFKVNKVEDTKENFNQKLYKLKSSISKKQKTYKYIITKNNIKLELDSIVTFCINNKLTYSSITDLFNKTKNNTVIYKGWTIQRENSKYVFLNTKYNFEEIL